MDLILEVGLISLDTGFRPVICQFLRVATSMVGKTL